MDRSRYEGYITVRDAVGAEVPDPFVAEVVCDLAEGLLLARTPEEAQDARREVGETFGDLVDRGELPRRAAGRFWVLLRACGPPGHWPPSWVRAEAPAEARAVRGH